MKWLTTFMAALVLFLSLHPCSDGEDHSHACQDHDLSQVSTMTHSAHGENFEHCSPLCHCSCCKTAVTVHHITLLPPMTGMELKPFPPLDDQFLSEHIHNILQPPRA